MPVRQANVVVYTHFKRGGSTTDETWVGPGKGFPPMLIQSIDKPAAPSRVSEMGIVGAK